jgi:predicted amidohydrolase YtcJ
MTVAADLVLTNGEVHTLTNPDVAATAASRDRARGHADETHEAVAIRDGEIVRVDSTYEVEFLAGIETEVIDLDGRVVLPGFIDAHTHMTTLGRRLVHADLSGAENPDDCVDLLRESAREDREWILGFGFDESTWDEGHRRYLDREDLDRVSTERPVVAFREDGHTAAVNSVALDRHLGEMPEDEVHREGGEPTGSVVEDAVEVLYRAVEPGIEETRQLLRAAQQRANNLGVTGVHDMVRKSHAPQAYRELDLAGELTVRVRLNYWSDHLASVVDAGLRTNHGSGLVRTGAIKSFTDGSLGGRTAKLSEPYHDAEDEDERGQWVVAPEDLREIVREADGADLQVAVHAIGDEAIEETLSAFEAEADDPGAARHRVEHVELASDDHVERFAESGIVASMQPNFLRWAHEDGLYDARIGAERRKASNRFRAFQEAGAKLAFGSDGMPLDPLYGVHEVVNASVPEQRLSVTEALRAYTSGAAYVGFDEDRLGTVEVGKRADLVVLERSPWEHPEEIENIDVSLTVVDGDVVYDGT